MTIRLLTYSFIALTFVLLAACQREEGSYTDLENLNGNPHADKMLADAEGNLYITNQLGENLYLYCMNKDYELELKKIIPADTANFLINIENNGQTIELKVWRESDLSSPDSPDEALIFRRWHVILATNTNEANRSSWIIKDNDGLDIVDGTVYLSYPDTGVNNISVIYSVDVYLNSKTGAKVASLAPGTTNRKVGIEYGYHVFYFRYWYSDPNGTQGSQQVGWIESDSIGNAYDLVLNSQTDNREMDIPIYYASSIGRTGILHLTNGYNQTVQVLADGEPIEDIIVSTEPTNGLSYMEKGSSYNFIIPEGNYRFSVQNITQGTELEAFDAQAIEPYVFNYILTDTIDYDTLTISNQTDKRVSIHNADNMEYLGLWLAPGQSKELIYNKRIRRLRAEDWFGNYFKMLGSTATTQWTISELVE